MSLPLVAEISISKLLYNLKQVKKLTGKSKICAVVKSNAYGHGVVEIANALYSKVDCFAVSLESECVKLRLAGIDKEIILLTPVYEENAERLILKDITLTVSSLKELKLIRKFAKKTGKKVKVHFALNTGMNRLGFDNVSQVERAILYLKRNKNILLTGAFSHLNDISNVKYTSRQKQVFDNLIKPIKSYNKNAVIHLSASGGTLLGNNYLYDMVRVGIMLYGYFPIKTDKIKLKPIMKIKSRVVLDRVGVKNKRVTYGDYKSISNRISVLRMGYADGIKRSNTLGVLGNACMDLCAVKKITGKYYVVNDVTALSENYQTITYETLVNILSRAERIYK